MAEASAQELLIGAKEIAAHLGRSERWLRYRLARRRDPHPLPVRVDGRLLIASRTELWIWVHELPQLQHS